jgi:hypothetical protein
MLNLTKLSFLANQDGKEDTEQVKNSAAARKHLPEANTTLSTTKFGHSTNANKVAPDYETLIQDHKESQHTFVKTPTSLQKSPLGLATPSSHQKSPMGATSLSKFSASVIKSSSPNPIKIEIDESGVQIYSQMTQVKDVKVKFKNPRLSKDQPKK